VFFGESMFSRMTDASKIALVHLRDHIQERGFRLIDAQVHTPHLESLGAEMIPRRRFAELVRQYTAENDLPGKWSA
jgi:leucyl/phenylalanyl-tRNA--protein transferase